MKILLVLSIIITLFGCASAGKSPSGVTTTPLAAPVSDNPQAHFAWSVDDLVKTLKAGDKRKLKKLYIVPSELSENERSESVHGSSVPNAYIDEVRLNVVAERLVNQFKGQDIKISDIDDLDQTVRLRIAGVPVMPLVWNFKLNVGNGSYGITDYHSEIFDLKFNQFSRLYASSFFYGLQTMSIEQREEFKNSEFAQKRAIIAEYYSEKEQLSTVEAKILIELILSEDYKGISSKDHIESNILSKTNNANDLTYMGYRLFAAAKESNYQSALDLLDEMELLITDSVAINTSRAYYQLKLNRLDDARKTIVGALSYETDNPWLFTIAREIAIKQKNEVLLERLESLAITTFGHSLSEYSKYINKKI